MQRGRLAALVALVFSLALHAALMAGLMGWTSEDRKPPPLPDSRVTARLILPPAPQVVTAPPDRPVNPRPRPAPAERNLSEPKALLHSVAEDEEPDDAPVGIEAGDLPADENTRAEEEGMPEPTAETEDLAADPVPDPEIVQTASESPASTMLPVRIEMVFDLHYGIAGGEQKLVWESEGGSYTLTSTAVATGLAGVFYRGRFEQTSQGRISPQGLLPQTFVDRRGDRVARATLDPEAGRIQLTTATGETRQMEGRPGLQDVLSLVFQLALTGPSAGEQRVAVFNGRALREYTFELRGVKTLETVLGAMDTLHVARIARPGERFEIWLAVDRFYLPVRMVRSDDKGNEMVLQVRSITP